MADLFAPPGAWRHDVAFDALWPDADQIDGWLAEGQARALSRAASLVSFEDYGLTPVEAATGISFDDLHPQAIAETSDKLLTSAWTTDVSIDQTSSRSAATISRTLSDAVKRLADASPAAQ